MIRRSCRRLAGCHRWLCSLVVLAYVVIVDQTEAVIRHRIRPAGAADRASRAAFQVAASERPRLRPPAPARHAARARDVDEGQEEPRGRLVRELADRRRRAFPAYGADDARRVGAARGHGGVGAGGRAGRSRAGRARRRRRPLGARRDDERPHPAHRRAGGAESTVWRSWPSGCAG